MIKKGIALSLTAMLLFAVAAPMAMAVTRDEYKAQVEPICKTNSEANDRILKPVRREVEAEQVEDRRRQVHQGLERVEEDATTSSMAVEQPAEDAAKLTKWLGYVKTEADLFKSAGKALKAGNKSKAQKFVNKLTKNANQANSTVLAFNFRYCKFEPSKYT